MCQDDKVTKDKIMHFDNKNEISEPDSFNCYPSDLLFNLHFRISCV